MAFDVFLHRLRQQLKGFSPEDQTALIDEISSHIESGEQDHPQDGDEETRRQKLMNELGSPEDMGKAFKEVHRPNRWRDFLMVVLPPYLFFTLFNLIFFRFANPRTDMFLYEQIVGRLIILMGFGLALFGVRSHSILVLAYWIPNTLSSLISLMTREQRWLPGQEVVPGELSVLESFFWYAVLFGLVFWFGKFLWKNRGDWLIALFALLPVITLVFNVSSHLLSGLFNIEARLFYWNIYGLGFGTLITIFSLAGIFLLQKRSLRWLAYLMDVLTLSIQNTYAYWPNPPIIAMWMCLPILLAVVAWFDWRAHHPAIFPTTTPTTPAH